MPICFVRLKCAKCKCSATCVLDECVRPCPHGAYGSPYSENFYFISSTNLNQPEAKKKNNSSHASLHLLVAQLVVLQV